MSFENLLNHKCDIYHIVKTQKSPGYNLKSSPSFGYLDIADITPVNCHFGTKSKSVTIAQNEPYAEFTSKVKLALPINTDIRLNDKVVDVSTNTSYIAGMPINIRDHHISVYLKAENEYL